MRIVVDLQGAQTESRYRGIGRYSLSFTRALLQQSSEHEFWVILNSRFTEAIDYIEGQLADVLPRSRIRVFDAPSNIAKRTASSPQMAAAAEIIREAFLADLEPDLVLITSLFEGYLDDAVTSIGLLSDARVPTAVVHYDLIPAVREGYINSTEYAEFYQRKLASLKQADLLLAISEHSRSEVAGFLDLSTDRVINISAAVDERFREGRATEVNRESDLGDLGIKSQYVLYIPGGFDPRKNVCTLFEAYAKLPPVLREEYQLVIGSKASVQAASECQAAAESAGLAAKEWVLTGYVESSRLVDLYRGSTLFVFPSVHEGFGLPLLEAMTLGVPCIASSTTSVGEVMGSSVYSFDPEDAEEIAEKLSRALQDEAWRAELAEHSLARASNFSWHRTAQLAVAALEEMLERRNRQDAHLPESTGLTRRKISDAITACSAELGFNENDSRALARCLAANLKGDGKAKLFLDITELARVDGKSGIQRVVRALLLALSRGMPHGFAIKPVIFDGQHFRHANRFSSWFLGCDTAADDLIDPASGDQYLSLDLNVASISSSSPQLESLRRKGVKLNFLVYDILPIQHPEWWPAGLADGFATWFDVVSRISDRLICISRSVRDQVASEIASADINPLSRPKLGWFHLGADIENTAPTVSLPRDAERFFERTAGQITFLMVGTVEPRKGHELVLDAFSRLWSDGHKFNLVVIGKKGWLVDDLADRLTACSRTESHLFWFEGASDEFLERAYEASSCLIAASEAEGFGLPLIEASFHGLPVLARDIEVFREVAGEAALYFDGDSAESLVDGVLGWVDAHTNRKVPDPRSMRVMSWTQSAEALLEQLMA